MQTYLKYSQDKQPSKNIMLTNDASTTKGSSMNIDLEEWLLEAFDPIAANMEDDQLMDPWKNASTHERKKIKLGTESFIDESAFTKSCNRWTQIEDIFLTGIIMDMYCLRHSLKGRKGEQGQGRQTVWEVIHATYCRTSKRYNEHSERKIPFRTLKALQKRWQETGSSGRDGSSYARILQTKKSIS